MRSPAGERASPPGPGGEPEACPFFPGQPVIAHWGMPDPAAVMGTDEEKRRAFDDTVLTLRRRLDSFLALPLDKLSRLAPENQVKDIGR